MTLALSTTTEQREKATAFCQHDKAEAGTFVPFGHLSLQFGGTPWAPVWAGQTCLMLWVPEKHPQALVFSTHFLASLLSMPPCLWGPSTSSQTHVPQVTDMLQKMITTICSLKTTAERLPQQISQRELESSFAKRLGSPSTCMDGTGAWGDWDDNLSQILMENALKLPKSCSGCSDPPGSMSPSQPLKQPSILGIPVSWPPPLLLSLLQCQENFTL